MAQVNNFSEVVSFLKNPLTHTRAVGLCEDYLMLIYQIFTFFCILISVEIYNRFYNRFSIWNLSNVYEKLEIDKMPSIQRYSFSRDRFYGLWSPQRPTLAMARNYKTFICATMIIANSLNFLVDPSLWASSKIGYFSVSNWGIFIFEEEPSFGIELVVFGSRKSNRRRSKA